MEAPHRMRVVALGAAVVALVLTAVAVVVVVVRDPEPPPPPVVTKEPVAPVIDRDVRATDVARLQRNELEVVVESGVAKGLRVKDPALAQALGLEDGDVITSISGRTLTREGDSLGLISRLSMLEATVLYVEVARKDQPALVRWRLDGDLRQARYGTPSSGLGSLGTYTPSYTPPPDDPDPLFDTIEKLDDMHYKLPRKTAAALLADPMKYGKQARIVPSLRNGQPFGLKLYAIRPSSVFAKLGLSNGDTIHAINGLEITSIDKALEVYAKLEDAGQLTLELTRRGRPASLVIEITK